MSADDGRLQVSEVDGVRQLVGSDRARLAGERFDADVAYAEKAEEHVWIVAVAHRITGEHARAVHAGKEPALLDAESAVITGIGCYRCETPFEPRMVGRRCRGVR